jgi:hypothetical protein
MARDDKPEEISKYYRNFIQEVPPKRSKFIKNGEYITPDGEYTTPVLKIEFRSL